MKKTISIIFYLFLCSFNIIAQKGTVAAGGNASGVNGTISYSIGQIDYVTITDSGFTITEGQQQPYEIYVTTGIDETGINLIASVYPNPSNEFLTLVVENNRIENLFFQLYDLQGKLLMNKKIERIQTAICIKEFADDIYFIKIRDRFNDLKTFKIVKNN